MSHIIKLLLERKVSVLEVLQWLLSDDESSVQGPAALQEAAQHKREFVPLFLNALRLQANRHVLPSTPVRASSQAPSCSWQGRGSFPIKAVKYVSPQKAVRSFGPRAPRVGVGAKLDFGSTPARSKNFQSSWQECYNEERVPSSSQTEDLGVDRTSSIHSPNFQERAAGPDRSFVLSPTEAFVGTPSRGRLCASTPKNSSSGIGLHAVLRPGNSSSALKSSAAWDAPVELSSSLHSTDNIARGEGHWKKQNNTPGSTKAPQKYSEQKNTLKDYMVASSGKKAPRRKAASFNNSSGSPFPHETRNNSWTGRSVRTKLDLSDSSSFPSLGQSSAAAQLSSYSESRAEKNKKKRIKPTRLKCSTENVDNNKKGKTPSLGQAQTMPTQLEENALSVETKSSNSCGLQEERKMLKQLKAEIGAIHKISVNIAQNCTPKNEVSISRKSVENKQSTPSNSNSKILRAANVTSRSKHIHFNESTHDETFVRNGISSSSHQLQKEGNGAHSPILEEDCPSSKGIADDVRGRDMALADVCETCCTPARVTQRAALDICGALYSRLLLCNLTASLASELHFILQLLTIKDCLDTSQNADQEDLLGLPDLLNSTHNCVYFASSVLRGLSSLLILFDRSLVRLLAENKRLQLFVPALQKELQHQAHSRLSKPSPKQLPRSPMKSVPFLQEVDNRSNFPDNSTFHIFKKQRDIFYKLLRDWEHGHESPDWVFSYRLGNSVRSLLQLGSGSCNMAHLARLFVAQLLCACEAGHATPALDDDDDGDVLTLLKRQHPEKFERLQERLVAPSCASSTAVPSPSFPGVQQFFRDFITEAASPPLNAHLEDQLIAKLSDLLGVSDGDQRGPSASSLLLRQAGVLGKFVGVLWFAPYFSTLALPQLALAQQVALRSKVQLRLPLCAVLRSCAVNGCLVAAVLSCVQLLSIADAVALHTCHLQTVVFVLMYIYKLALGTCVYATLQPAKDNFVETATMNCVASSVNHHSFVSGQTNCGHVSSHECFNGENIGVNFSLDNASPGDERFISKPIITNSSFAQGKDKDDEILKKNCATDFLPFKSKIAPQLPANLDSNESLLESPSPLKCTINNGSLTKHEALCNGPSSLTSCAVKPNSNSTISCLQPSSPVCSFREVDTKERRSKVENKASLGHFNSVNEDESLRNEHTQRFALWEPTSSKIEKNDADFLKLPLESPIRVKPSISGECDRAQPHPRQENKGVPTSKKTVFSPEVSLFLRLLLGWLFDQPVFPDGLFYTDPYSTNIDIKEYNMTIGVVNDHYCTGCGHVCSRLPASSVDCTSTGRRGGRSSGPQMTAKPARILPPQRGLLHTPPRQTAKLLLSVKRKSSLASHQEKSNLISYHEEENLISEDEANLLSTTGIKEHTPSKSSHSAMNLQVNEGVNPETALPSTTKEFRDGNSEAESGSKTAVDGSKYIACTSPSAPQVKQINMTTSGKQVSINSELEGFKCSQKDMKNSKSVEFHQVNHYMTSERVGHSSRGEVLSPTHSSSDACHCAKAPSWSTAEGSCGVAVSVPRYASSCPCPHTSCRSQFEGCHDVASTPQDTERASEGSVSPYLSAKGYTTPLKSGTGGPGAGGVGSPEVRLILQDTPQRVSIVENRPLSPPPKPYRFDEHVIVDSQLLKEWCPQLLLLEGLLKQGSPDRGGGVRKITPLSALPGPSQQVGGPVAGLTKAPLQHSLQHQLEESFFHQQPASVRQCVAFLSDRLATNCLRHLRTSLVPAASALASRALEEQLESAFGLSENDQSAGDSVEFTSAEQVEHIAKQQVQLTLSALRSQLTDQCLQHLHEQLQQQQQLLHLLLPSDTSDKVVEVCGSIVQRCCRERVSAWLRQDLAPSTPPSLFSPLTRALLKRVITKYNLNVTPNWSLTLETVAHTPPPPAAGGSYVQLPAADGGHAPPSAADRELLTNSKFSTASVATATCEASTVQISSCDGTSVKTSLSNVNLISTPFSNAALSSSSTVFNRTPITTNGVVNGTAITSAISSCTTSVCSSSKCVFSTSKSRTTTSVHISSVSLSTSTALLCTSTTHISTSDVKNASHSKTTANVRSNPVSLNQIQSSSNGTSSSVLESAKICDNVFSNSGSKDFEASVISTPDAKTSLCVLATSKEPMKSCDLESRRAHSTTVELEKCGGSGGVDGDHKTGNKLHEGESKGPQKDDENMEDISSTSSIKNAGNCFQKDSFGTTAAHSRCGGVKTVGGGNTTGGGESTKTGGGSNSTTGGGSHTKSDGAAQTTGSGGQTTGGGAGGGATSGGDGGNTSDGAPKNTDAHDITAPIPSLLKAEMKALVKTLLNSISTPGLPKFRSCLRPPYGSPHSLASSTCSQDISAVKNEALDGVFRERPRPGPALPVCEDQLRALAVAVRDCVSRRTDLTSPLLRGLKTLSVDIITTVCAAYPELATPSVLSDYTALWGPEAPLECPPSLPTTILAPRVFRLVELRAGGSCAGMRRLVQACVQQELLQPHLLHESAVALLQHCWTQDVLQGLSTLVDDLCGPQEEESVVSFLPWLCSEMENFPE